MDTPGRNRAVGRAEKNDDATGRRQGRPAEAAESAVLEASSPTARRDGALSKRVAVWRGRILEFSIGRIEWAIEGIRPYPFPREADMSPAKT